MARVVMIGGGIGGTTAATLLQHDGHQVTVLERDPKPPGVPADAWNTWERRGVNQFRLPHFILARYTEIVRTELPELATGWSRSVAHCVGIPSTCTPVSRAAAAQGDEQFDVLTGRRPTIEAIAARHAALVGVDVRRGTASGG